MISKFICFVVSNFLELLSIILSGVAIYYAVIVPKKIAEKQNDIALFEKRYEGYLKYLEIKTKNDIGIICFKNYIQNNKGGNIESSFDCYFNYMKFILSYDLNLVNMVNQYNLFVSEYKSASCTQKDLINQEMTNFHNNIITNITIAIHQHYKQLNMYLLLFEISIETLSEFDKIQEKEYQLIDYMQKGNCPYDKVLTKMSYIVDKTSKLTILNEMENQLKENSFNKNLQKNN